MKTEAIRYCIQAQFGKEDYAEARLELTALETKINRLTTFNESMQTDARKNTATINKQAAEIETLKSILRDAEVEINIQTGGGNYSELLGNIRTALTGES
jgi:hypothetical protein